MDCQESESAHQLMNQIIISKYKCLILIIGQYSKFSPAIWSECYSLARRQADQSRCGEFEISCKTVGHWTVRQQHVVMLCWPHATHQPVIQAECLHTNTGRAEPPHVVQTSQPVCLLGKSTESLPLSLAGTPFSPIDINWLCDCDLQLCKLRQGT